jgi:translation initiation factor 5A
MTLSRGIGMGEIKIESVGSIKKGRFVIIDGEPCKVVSVDISKTGKHGHAKARIVGFGIFDNSRHTLLKPTHDKVEMPIIDKKPAQVLSVSGDTAQLMDLTSYETFELPIPDDMKNKVVANAQITYWEVMDKRILKSS